MNESEVVEAVRALERADLETLRAIWRERIGAAPRVRSADLLRRILAWRLQAAVYDDLTSEDRQALRGGRSAEPTLRPGVRLTREWRGRLHEVEVTGDGFIHDGRRYASLSQIATRVTGTRWNGPRFFGLRREASA